MNYGIMMGSWKLDWKEGNIWGNLKSFVCITCRRRISTLNGQGVYGEMSFFGNTDLLKELASNGNSLHNPCYAIPFTSVQCQISTLINVVRYFLIVLDACHILINNHGSLLHAKAITHSLAESLNRLVHIFRTGSRIRSSEEQTRHGLLLLSQEPRSPGNKYTPIDA